jgi:saccharopine dehydrogenase-like NADP-dependent oxidoreductase
MKGRIQLIPEWVEKRSVVRHISRWRRAKQKTTSFLQWRHTDTCARRRSGTRSYVRTSNSDAHRWTWSTVRQSYLLWFKRILAGWWLYALHISYNQTGAKSDKKNFSFFLCPK